MNPVVQQVETFRVAGIGVRTTNADEASADTAQLGLLWGRFFGENIPGKVGAKISDSPIYGVYSEYASDVNGEYSVTAGVQIEPSATGGGGFKHVDVASGEYLVFAGQGAMPQVVIDTWKEVWGYFSQASEFRRAYTTDFEVYKGMDEVAIHISVRRNIQ
jgi:predicted transcriptional regulator YdeE